MVHYSKIEISWTFSAGTLGGKVKMKSCLRVPFGGTRNDPCTPPQTYNIVVGWEKVKLCFYVPKNAWGGTKRMCINQDWKNFW